jgi:hypothetical protein
MQLQILRCAQDDIGPDFFRSALGPRFVREWSIQAANLEEPVCVTDAFQATAGAACFPLRAMAMTMVPTIAPATTVQLIQNPSWGKMPV